MRGNSHVRFLGGGERGNASLLPDLLLPVCGESEEHAIIRASFDGLTAEGRPVELKAPCEKNFRAICAEGKESLQFRSHYPQIQHQLYVAGADKGWLSYYFAGQWRDFEIGRDERFIQDHLAKCLEFWALVQSGQEPPKDPARDFFIPSGQDLDEWTRLSAEYRNLSEMLSGWDAEVERLKQQAAAIEKRLAQKMGAFVLAECAGIRVTRYLQSGVIDYKAALKALAPDADEAALEKFRRKGSERTRITVKDEDKTEVPFDAEALKKIAGENFYF